MFRRQEKSWKKCDFFQKFFPGSPAAASIPSKLSIRAYNCRPRFIRSANNDFAYFSPINPAQRARIRTGRRPYSTRYCPYSGSPNRAFCAYCRTQTTSSPGKIQTLHGYGYARKGQSSCLLRNTARQVTTTRLTDRACRSRSLEERRPSLVQDALSRCKPLHNPMHPTVNHAQQIARENRNAERHKTNKRIPHLGALSVSRRQVLSIYRGISLGRIWKKIHGKTQQQEHQYPTCKNGAENDNSPEAIALEASYQPRIGSDQFYEYYRTERQRKCRN